MSGQKCSGGDRLINAVSGSREQARSVSVVPNVATSWYAELNRNISTETCAREHSIAKVL